MKLSSVAAMLLASLPCVVVAEEESAFDLSQVIVTATRSPEPAVDAIASVTVITRADIDRLQPQSVADLLTGLAGISISSTGDLGKATSVNMRGTNSDHVLVLIDGVKIGSATIGTAAFEQLPVEQIDHIEIVRGPLSSLYGSEAIGGVIQIFTRHGAPGAPDVPSLMVSGGSHGTYQAEAGESGSVGNGWYNTSASGLYTSGIPICAANAPVTASCYTTTPQQGYWTGSAAVSGGYRWDAATVTFDFLQAEGDTHYDGTVYSGDESRVGQQVLGATLAFPVWSPWSVTLAAGQSKDLSQLYFADAPDGFFDTRRDTASWLNQLTFTPAQKLLLGVDYEQDNVASDADYPVASRYDVGTFGLYEWSGSQAQLQLSLRRDKNQQFGDHDTGAAQWAYRFSDALRVTASYGTAFKAPTFNDLYFPFYGDPNLLPETSHSVEVGLNGRGGALDWSVNAYQTQINNLIEYNPATGGAANLDSARIRGLETQIGTELAGWRVQLALTLLDPKDTGVDNGELLPHIAHYTGRLDVDRDIGAFSVGATLFTNGQRFDDPANTEPLGGYTTLDLRTAWRFAPHWEVQAVLRNATGRSYETALYYNQLGRSAYLTLRYVPGTP